jgi:hypothetical protein
VVDRGVEGGARDRIMINGSLRNDPHHRSLTIPSGRRDVRFTAKSGHC